MNDDSKDNDPTILADADLDGAAGGVVKIMKLDAMADSFTTVTGINKTSLKGDKGDVLIQNIGFPDDGGGGSKR